MPPLKGAAVLFSEMTPPRGGEEAFNRWYFGHHMPRHVYGVPGFFSGQRYKDASAPRYLAVYELASSSALADPEYRRRKHDPDPPTREMLSRVTGFTRYVADETGCRTSGGGAAAALGASAVVAEFFGGDGGPAPALDGPPVLPEEPGWRMTRRLRIVDADPDPFTHMLLHYVDARVSAAPRAAAGGPRASVRRAVAYGRHGRRYRKGEPEAAAFVPGPAGSP